MKKLFILTMDLMVFAPAANTYKGIGDPVGKTDAPAAATAYFFSFLQISLEICVFRENRAVAAARAILFET